MNFLAPVHVKVAAKFVAALEGGAANEAWPEELTGMPALKSLYLKSQTTVPLVCAYLRMVTSKVNRLVHYYFEAAEECQRDTPAPEPDEEAIKRHRNPLSCGGTYYVNDCKAALVPHAGDVFEADHKNSCNKNVSGVLAEMQGGGESY